MELEALRDIYRDFLGGDTNNNLDRIITAVDDYQAQTHRRSQSHAKHGAAGNVGMFIAKQTQSCQSARTAENLLHKIRAAFRITSKQIKTVHVQTRS